MSNITPERIAELRRLLAARAHPCADHNQFYAVVNAAVASMPDLLDEIERLQKDQQDLRTGVALIAFYLGEHRPRDLDAVRIANVGLKIRAENERLRALLPKAFDAGVIACNGDPMLGEAFRDEWVKDALEGKC